MQLQIDLNRAEPAWQQIADGVLGRLAAGAVGVGDRLPSVRGLAQAVRVNPNTVARAYRELESLGAVEGRQGRGVFVTPGGPQVARRRQERDLDARIRDVVSRALGTGLTANEIRAAVESALTRDGRRTNA